MLFDYDAASNSWKQRDLDVELPDVTGIFSRGKDQFFVDAELPNGEGDYDRALLSVLRDGSDHLEMLGEMPPDFEYSIYFASLMIAAGGRYVYLSGTEPITDGGSGTLSPKALFRLTLDEDDHVIDMDVFAGELVELGIAAKGDGLLYPAVAAGPCGGIIVGGNGEIASDTFLWKGGSDVLEAHNRTSSYFRSNFQTTVYHEGKLYALGYSPSEDGKMFRRRERCIVS